MVTGTGNSTACSDWGKANFGAIYDCPDPRKYFTTLQSLEYQIPHHGQAVFRSVTDALGRLRPEKSPLTVVDLCCSYGINATLLNYQVALSDLYARYTAQHLAAWTSHQLAEDDRTFFAQLRSPRAVRVVGIDSAARAARYAESVGLVDRAFAENLEETEPSAALRRAVADTDLIMVTGGVGYVFTRTFARLLDCMSEAPWIAAFVLRTVPYQPIADLLAAAGLVTEKVTDRTFRQRRFADDGERRAAFGALAVNGVSPEGKETDGYYHTDLYVSRPPADAEALPLGRLLPAW